MGSNPSSTSHETRYTAAYEFTMKPNVNEMNDRVIIYRAPSRRCVFYASLSHRFSLLYLQSIKYFPSGVQCDPDRRIKQAESAK